MIYIKRYSMVWGKMPTMGVLPYRKVRLAPPMEQDALLREKTIL